jgi:predicted MFS family arabinose efflux permease
MDRRSSASSDNNQGFKPVLTNPRFLILWTGQIFSQLADKIYLVLMIALTAIHFKAEGQSISGWTSAIMIAFTIPAILFGSLAGVYVDRWSKKGVMVISNLLRAALVFVIPPLLWLAGSKTVAFPVGWLPEFLRHWQSHLQDNFYLPLGFLILLILTFLDSTITQFFAPTEQVVIPLIVKRRHLLPANSLFTTTMMAMTIVGFAIGDPLLDYAARLAQALGLSATVGQSFVVGLSYLLAGLILVVLRLGEKIDPANTQYPHVFEDMKDGLRYLAQNQRVRNALVQLVILFSVFAALSVLAVPMMEQMPGMKARQFGYLLAAAGVGMAISAYVLGNIGQRFTNLQLSLVGSLGMGISLVGMSLFTKNLLLSFLMIALMGSFAALVGVPMQTTIQSETPVDMRGKVFGLQNNAVNIALSLPLALAGIAETLFGLRSVLIALAVLPILGGLLTYFLTPAQPSKR